MFLRHTYAIDVKHTACINPILKNKSEDCVYFHMNGAGGGGSIHVQIDSHSSLSAVLCVMQMGKALTPAGPRDLRISSISTWAAHVNEAQLSTARAQQTCSYPGDGGSEIWEGVQRLLLLDLQQGIIVIVHCVLSYILYEIDPYMIKTRERKWSRVLSGLL